MRWKTTLTAALAASILATLCGCWWGNRREQAAAVSDAHDRAYRQLRAARDGCPPDQQVTCCQSLRSRMDAALAAGEGREAAETLDALALGCPHLRSAALAALDAAGKVTGPPPPPRPAAVAADTMGRASVAYQIDLPPDDRLYWAAAFFDGKHPPGTRLPAGLHTLQVELHVVPLKGPGKDQLFRLEASGQVELESGREHEVVVLVRRAAPGAAQPFVVTFVSGDLGQAPPPGAAPAPPAPPAPARVTVPPAVAASLRKSIGPAHLPTELSRGQQEWSLVKLCVDAEGKLETIQPLRTLHPRHTGMMLDMGRRAQHRPHVVGGQTVPYCYPLLVTWNL